MNSYTGVIPHWDPLVAAPIKFAQPILTHTHVQSMNKY